MLVCSQPVDQHKSGAAAVSRSSPAGQSDPAAQPVAEQAFATDAAPMAVPSDEETGTGASIIPHLSSAEPSGTAAASQAANVLQGINRTPQGQCQKEGTEVEERAAELRCPQAASVPMSSTPSSCDAPVSVAQQSQLPSVQQSEDKQPPDGLQSAGVVSDSRVLGGCATDRSAGASAAASPFIRSPTTGVVRAIHSSPASPADDTAAQHRPIFGAQLGSGKQYVASPLGPPPQQQTCSDTESKNALISGSAGALAQADVPTPKEQPGKPASDVQGHILQSAAAAHAAGDRTAQYAAHDRQVAQMEKEPAKEAYPSGGSALEDALPAEQMKDAACAATSPDNTKVRCAATEIPLFSWHWYMRLYFVALRHMSSSHVSHCPVSVRNQADSKDTS